MKLMYNMYVMAYGLGEFGSKPHVFTVQNTFLFLSIFFF